MNNLETKQKILEKIKQYDKIVISRHIRPDGDAVGSTMGLAEILRATFPQKTILLVNEDYADYTAFLGEEDKQPDDSFYDGALLVVCDVGTIDRISNKKAGLAKEIVKIDHHIDDKPYGDVSWVEDYRSSACEMIVDFYDTFKNELTLTQKAATCLYVGMVTDSGRFKFEAKRSTMEMAGLLLDQGINTEWIFANLYLDDFANFKRQSKLYDVMQLTENGVAWMFLSNRLQRKLHLSSEEASNQVGLMDGIKGSIAWLCFIEQADGSIRVRLRSRFVTVQEIALNYHGGGHACAAGATVYSKKEMLQLVADVDKHVGAYKNSHEGWM